MKIGPIRSGAGLTIVIYHTILAITLPLYFYFYSLSWQLVLASIVLYFISGLSITAAYHRYYSHKTFQANTLFELFFLFFGTMAGQGSALRWSFDHRLHHAHVDTDKDPYSINKGFWYAHILWLMEEQSPIDPKVVPDLLSNKLVVFQDRHYGKLVILTNYLAFAFVGWLCNDNMGAFFLALWLRLFALHHCTWFINSLAHVWGSKSYSREVSAVDNYIISFLTFGEGYHNYHHTFARDYRNGIRWYHFDPTKWLIWSLNKIRMTWGLKKMDNATIQRRMVMKDKDLLIARIKELYYVNKEVLEEKVQDLSESLASKTKRFYILVEQYNQYKKANREKESLQALKLEIKALKKSIRQEWKSWSILSHQIMNLKPLTV